MGCTSALSAVSTGLRADRKNRLGGACAIVPNQLTGGLKVQVKRLAWLSWWNQHVRGNTVEVCCGFLGGVTGVQSGPTPNQVGGITTADAGVVARLYDRGGICYFPIFQLHGVCYLSLELVSAVFKSPSKNAAGQLMTLVNAASHPTSIEKRNAGTQHA